MSTTLIAIIARIGSFRTILSIFRFILNPTVCFYMSSISLFFDFMVSSDLITAGAATASGFVSALNGFLLDFMLGPA